MNAEQYNAVEIGRHIVWLRDQLAITQAELARRTSISQASLSRIETGDRLATAAEIQEIVEKISTPDAARLPELLSRSWRSLPRPPLDHLDLDLLWKAENATHELATLRSHFEISGALRRRVCEYIEELKRLGALLLKRDHQIAFIGSIGIGKTTAICRLIGLELLKDDGTKVPGLDVGGGGTTVCEVHLRSGPQFGLIVEPRSETEVRHDVEDLIEQIVGGTNPDESLASADSQGVSTEVSRSIRNMANLAIQRSRTPEGKRTVNDPIRNLAQTYPERSQLVIEILSRMALHQRDRRDVWYDSAAGKSPIAWLRDTFSLINSGLHKEFALPKRIEVLIPRPILNVAGMTVRLIDTKGIDRTAAREDIEYLLDDPHTLVVLCSSFNNAPAAETRLLLERAQEAGNHDLSTHVSLLVLPRPGEALAMKDDATCEPVENVQEGYELKSDQVSLSLAPLRMGNLGVGFFNAYDDLPTQTTDFLIHHLSTLRQSFRSRLQTVVNGARLVIENQREGRGRSSAAVANVSKSIHVWITKKRKIWSTTRIPDSLLAEIQVAYASTVRASIRRQGEWTHLSYGHHIGYGARKLAYTAVGKFIEEFQELCTLLLDDPEYLDAAEFISQVTRVLEHSYEELLRKVQIAAQSLFRDEFHSDPSIWRISMEESGTGYKQRVAEHNRKWFDDRRRRDVEEQLLSLVEREWGKALQSVAALLDLGVSVDGSAEERETDAAEA